MICIQKGKNKMKTGKGRKFSTLFYFGSLEKREYFLLFKGKENKNIISILNLKGFYENFNFETLVVWKPATTCTFTYHPIHSHN